MPPPFLLRLSQHEELPLEQLAEYPNLSRLHDAWRAKFTGEVPPPPLEIYEIPRPLLPYLMLLELERETALLRIRLAGTEVCARHGGEMKGLTHADFFGPEDARTVYGDALRIAESRTPSLTRRAYVAINDRYWSYVRLMLPLSRGGQTADAFMKVVEPISMREAVRPG
jgi:hypothetical protein